MRTLAGHLLSQRRHIRICRWSRVRCRAELRTLSRLVLFDRGRPRRRLCRVGASRGSVTGVRDGGATTERHGNIFGCASFWAFRAADCDEEPGRCLGAIPSCCEGTLGGHQPTRIAMIVAIEATITVVHEIAHHFGIDDQRLHELGWD